MMLLRLECCWWIQEETQSHSLKGVRQELIGLKERERFTDTLGNKAKSPNWIKGERVTHTLGNKARLLIGSRERESRTH